MKAFIRAFRDRSSSADPSSPKAFDQTVSSNGGPRNGVLKLIRSSTNSSSISGFSTLPDPAAKGQKEVTVDLRSSIQEDVTPNGSNRGQTGLKSIVNGHNGPQTHVKQVDSGLAKNSASVTRTAENGPIQGSQLKGNDRSSMYAITGDFDVDGGSKSKDGKSTGSLPPGASTTNANDLHVRLKDSTPAGKTTTGNGLLGDRSNGEASGNALDAGMTSRTNGTTGKTLLRSGVGLEKVSEQQEMILSAPDEFRDSYSEAEARPGTSIPIRQSDHPGSFLKPMGKYEIKSSSFAYLPTVGVADTAPPIPGQPLDGGSTATSDDGALQGHNREDESTIYEKISESSRGTTTKGPLNGDKVSLNVAGPSHRQTSDLIAPVVLPSTSLSVLRGSEEDRTNESKAFARPTEKPEVSRKKPYSAIRDKQFKGRLESIIGRSSTPSVASAMSSVSRHDETTARGKVRTGIDATSEEHRAELEPAKKYRFLVHGIDIPKDVEEEDEEAGKGDDLDGVRRAERERKGFSYLLDRRLAEEVAKRATDVTSRKPHEAVEERGKTALPKTTKSDDDGILQDARLKLLQPRAEVGDAPEKREESQMLREIREQLKKRRRFEETSSSDEEEPDLMLDSAGGDTLLQAHRPTEQQVHRQSGQIIDQSQVISVIGDRESSGGFVEGSIGSSQVVTSHAVSRNSGKEIGTMIIIDDDRGTIEMPSAQSPRRQSTSTNLPPQGLITYSRGGVSTPSRDGPTSDSTTPTIPSPRYLSGGVRISVTDTIEKTHREVEAEEEGRHLYPGDAFRSTTDHDDKRTHPEYYAFIHPSDARDAAAAAAETGERRGSIDRRGRSFAVTRDKTKPPAVDTGGLLQPRPSDDGRAARLYDDGGSSLPPRPPDYGALYRPARQPDTSRVLRVDDDGGEVTEAGVTAVAVASSSSGSEHPHHMKRRYDDFPELTEFRQHAPQYSPQFPGSRDAHRHAPPVIIRPRGAEVRRGSSDEPSAEESFSSTSGFTDSSQATVTRRYERRGIGSRPTRSPRNRGTVHGRIPQDATDSDDRTQPKRPRPRSRSKSRSRGGDVTIITATSNDRLTADNVSNHPEPLVYGYITPERDFGVTDLESHDYRQRTLRSKLGRLRRPVATVHIEDSNGVSAFSEPEHDQSGHLIPTRLPIPTVQFRDTPSRSPTMRGLAPGFTVDHTMQRVNANRDIYGRGGTPLGAPSLEVTEVNPRLHDVGKRGNVYQVAMKLNAVLSSRSTSVSNSLNQYSSITDLAQHQQQHQHTGSRLSSDPQAPGFRNRPGSGGLNRPGSAGSLVVRIPVSPQPGDRVVDTAGTEGNHRSGWGLAGGEENYAIKSVRSSFRRSHEQRLAGSSGVNRSGVVNEDSPRSDSVDFRLELRTVKEEGMRRTTAGSSEEERRRGGGGGGGGGAGINGDGRVGINGGGGIGRNGDGGIDRTGDGNGMAAPLYTMTLNDTMTVAYKPGEEVEEVDVPDGIVGAGVRKERETPVLSDRGTNTDRPRQTAFSSTSRYDNEADSANQQRRHTRHHHHQQQQAPTHGIRRRQIDSTDAYNASSSALRTRHPPTTNGPAASLGRRKRVAMGTRRGLLRRSDGDDDDDDDEDEDAAAGDEDDLRRYLSPAETDDEETGRIRTNPSDFPKVVRGSILIRNSIDTTGGPRHLDVVAGDDPDGGGFVVEDNTNMFHRRYFQSRENPLYLSDPEYEEVLEVDSPSGGGQRRKRPAFAEVFHERDPSSRSKRKSPVRGQRTREVREELDGFDREVQINRGYNAMQRKGRRKPDRSKGGTPNGYDVTDSIETSRQYEISRLLENAPADSIRQSVNVQREEEELIGPLADGNATERMLNVDMVSEKVDLGLKDGVAQVTVRVRCERIVPIRGSTDMFKKSSVVVTRIIEIDLTATDERRRLYQRVLHGSSSSFLGRSTDPPGQLQGAQVPVTATAESKLNTRDTFDLYKTLMAMADADDARHVHQRRLQIDKELEEERRPYRDPAAALLDDEDDFDFGEPPEFDMEQLENRLEERIRPQKVSAARGRVDHGFAPGGARGGEMEGQDGQRRHAENVSSFLY